MFEKLGAIKYAFSFLRVGKEAANAVRLKQWQIVGSLCGTLIGLGAALLLAFGVDLHITEAAATTAGQLIGSVLVGGFGLWNLVSTSVSSDRAGLLPAKAVEPAGDGHTAFPELLPGVPVVAAPEVVQPAGKPVNSAPVEDHRIPFDQRDQYIG